MIDPAAIVISGGGDAISLFIEVVFIIAVIVVVVWFLRWLFRNLP